VRVWHPSGKQAALARLSGGRLPCDSETTTGYRLPTLPGWTVTKKEWGNLMDARAGTH
jgi:hypothetical protein